MAKSIITKFCLEENDILKKNKFEKEIGKYIEKHVDSTLTKINNCSLIQVSNRKG